MERKGNPQEMEQFFRRHRAAAALPTPDRYHWHHGYVNSEDRCRADSSGGGAGGNRFLLPRLSNKYR